jgi:hypothetical protein
MPSTPYLGVYSTKTRTQYATLAKTIPQGFRSLLIPLVWVSCFLSPAHAAYEDRHGEGWHWYEEVRKQEPVRERAEKKAPTQNADPAQADPAQALARFKKQVEHLKAVAVMDPSFANVKAYMEIQKLLLERSSRFAQRWLEVVYQTPQLDYTLKHPVSQVGRHVYADTQHKQMQRRIRQLAQTHGLFFFFSSSCDYCGCRHGVSSHCQCAHLSNHERRFGGNIALLRQSVCGLRRPFRPQIHH